MIRARVVTDMKEKTQSLINELNVQEDLIGFKMAGAVKSASEFIKRRLQELFPESQHFMVEFLPIGNKIYQINIVADEIGEYIYFGTSPHSITSDKAMPIGEGLFARSVQHPGTSPRKQEIDEIVNQAARIVEIERQKWGS